MSLFCKHEWVELKKTVLPSCEDRGLTTKRVPWTDSEMITVYGQVIYLWECRKCRKLRKTQMLGKEV